MKNLIATTGLILSILLLFAFLGTVIIPRAVRCSKDVAPFIPTRGAIIDTIIAALDLSSRSVLFDLGCGDARVLIAAARKFPGIKAIGIDNDWLPILVARFKSRLLPINIIRGEMYSTLLTHSTHIYCYLFPNALATLEAKIIAECRPGTKIVTCDFRFPTLTAIEVIDLPGPTYALAKRLFVYEITARSRN